MAVVLLGGSVLANSDKKPKISLEEAQSIALKRINGTVEQSNLITHHGKERYSVFVLESDGITAHELINARNGKVIWVKDELPEAANIK